MPKGVGALPAACALLRDTHEGFDRSVDIFDFSERNSMRRAAEVDPDLTPNPYSNPMLTLTLTNPHPIPNPNPNPNPNQVVTAVDDHDLEIDRPMP